MRARFYISWRNHFLPNPFKISYYQHLFFARDFFPVPFIKKIDDNGQEKMALYGFGCMPVFRAQDTDGI